MSDEQNRADERRHPRVENLQLVHMNQYIEDEESRERLATGRTLNLSRGGMRIELYGSVPLRSRVSLSVALDDHIVEVAGEVAYLEVIDNTKSVMGISFDELSEETQRIIQNHIDERLTVG
ncbi:MAG: PilZ domain-containing protein [Acidobacteriota bacterium]